MHSGRRASRRALGQLFPEEALDHHVRIVAQRLAAKELDVAPRVAEERTQDPGHHRLMRERFVPTASSFPLNAALRDACVAAIVRPLARCAVGTRIVSMLGDAAMCDLDQSWVRRQYAPAHYPAFHAPHGWHQDGARI